MNLLVDHNYIQQDTHIWKDETKGNKGYLASLLKHLHKQGYYKNNIPLTNVQIKEIALNTFGWELSIDTIKKASATSAIFNFIPAVSTI